MTMMPSSVSKRHLDEDLVERPARGSSWPPQAGAAAPPTASISSRKMMQGEFSFAWRKRSRRRDAAHADEHLHVAEPEIERKGTPASPAWPWRSSGLAVPGGRSVRTPWGSGRRPSRNFPGFWRKLDDLADLFLASSSPPRRRKRRLDLVRVMKRGGSCRTTRMLPARTLARIWRKRSTRRPAR